MATLTATDMSAFGAVQLTSNTLTSSDTFTYNPTKNPVLVIENDTVGAITINIDGDGNTSVDAAGLGAVDVSGGYDTASIGVGEFYAVRLKSIASYLAGTIAMTGGSGAKAYLLEF